MWLQYMSHYFAAPWTVDRSGHDAVPENLHKPDLLELSDWPAIFRFQYVTWPVIFAAPWTVDRSGHDAVPENLHKPDLLELSDWPAIFRFQYVTWPVILQPPELSTDQDTMPYQKTYINQIYSSSLIGQLYLDFSMLHDLLFLQPPELLTD